MFTCRRKEPPPSTHRFNKERDIALARRSYAQLRADPSHPSLHFKTVANGRFHSVRVGLYYRALGVPVPDGVHWFWIGTHGDYDKLVG
jgi:hypothetical protein